MAIVIKYPHCDQVQEGELVIETLRGCGRRFQQTCYRGRVLPANFKKNIYQATVASVHPDLGKGQPLEQAVRDHFREFEGDSSGDKTAIRIPIWYDDQELIFATYPQYCQSQKIRRKRQLTKFRFWLQALVFPLLLYGLNKRGFFNSPAPKS